MHRLLVTFLGLIPLTIHAEYLGNLSANLFDLNSIADPYGAGNPYVSNSVTNEFGLYGNPFSDQFATNLYATEALQLNDQQGNYQGKLSTNPYDQDSVRNPYGRYGSPDSSESRNNPYGSDWRIEGR